jgi:hypothetical protein
MAPARIDTPKTSQVHIISDNELELSSFTQNIVAFEAILAKMETEISGQNPSTDRLNIYQSEAQSLLRELQAQQARAVALRGIDDANVQRLQGLLTIRLGGVVQRAEEIVHDSVLKLKALDEGKAALEAAFASVASTYQFMTSDPSSLTVEEQRVLYASESGSDVPNAASQAASASLGSVADILSNSTKQLNEIINAHPEIKDQALPVLKQLVDLSIRAIMQRGAEGAPPPRGPVDTPPKHGDDDGMEPRIVSLEKFAEESRKDLRSIDVRLGRLETAADGIAKNMATKADFAELKGTAAKDAAELKGSISQLEATLLKWFIGTTIAMTGLAFAAARFIR